MAGIDLRSPAGAGSGAYAPLAAVAGPQSKKTAALFASTPTVAVLVDANAAQFGITWNANPSMAYWRGTYWLAFDGNDAGGTAEAAAGQKCFLMSSADGTTWSTPIRPFTDAANSNNPIVSSAVHFQPNLVVVNDQLWCFWTGIDGYVSKLTNPTDKWTTYRVEFASGNIPVPSSPAEGAPSAGQSKTATLVGFSDMSPFFPAQPTILSDGAVAVPVTMQSQSIDPTAPTTANTVFRTYKRNCVIYVTPDGSSWTLSEPIPISAVGSGSTPWEPFVVESANGDIQVFSRNNKTTGTDDQFLLVATSHNRRSFTAPIATGLEVPVARGSSLRASTSRWFMFHDDLPQQDLTDVSAINVDNRRNPTLFVSRTGGNDFIPGPSMDPSYQLTHYPQGMLVGSTVYVAAAQDKGNRRNLVLSKFTAPTDESLAYVYPRRASKFLTVAGPTFDSTGTAGWVFTHNDQAKTAAAFNPAGDASFAMFATFVDPGTPTLIDTRPAAATNGVLWRLDGLYFGSVGLTHGWTIPADVPVFIGVSVDTTAGKVHFSTAAGGATLTTVDRYVRSFLFSGQPTNGQTIVVDGTTYTFKTTPSGGTDVQIGATATATGDNLVAALASNGLTAYNRSDGYVFVRRADSASFTISSAATNVTAPALPLGGSLASVGLKVPSTSTALGLTAKVFNASGYGAALTDANMASVYNSLASALGYTPISGASAPAAASFALTSASTTTDFPGFDAMHPGATAGTDGSLPILNINGEGSASVELPFTRTSVQIRVRLPLAPTGTQKYVLMSFGTRTNPVRLYLAGDDPTTLKLNGIACGTITDPTVYSVIEAVVDSTKVVVNGVAAHLGVGARCYLGNPFGESLLLPPRLTYFDIASMQVTEVRSEVLTDRFAYRPIQLGRARLDAQATTTTTLNESGANGPAGTAGAQSAFYLDPADFPTWALLRMKMSILTNDVAPTSIFTVGLYPVTTVGGAAASTTITLGTVVTNSNAAISAPAADTKTLVRSADFAVPAAGWYAIGLIVGTNSMVASSSALVRATLEAKY